MPETDPSVAPTGPSAEAVASVEESLGRLVRQVRLSLKDAAAAVAPDLQPAGYSVLGALVDTGEATPGALADALGLDKSVLSRQIRVLEERGLVTGRPDPADGRVRILMPTPLARERFAAARARGQERLATRMQAFDPAEVEMLGALLGRLVGDPEERFPGR